MKTMIRSKDDDITYLRTTCCTDALLCQGPVAFAMNKLDGYDNKHPREQQSKLTGFGARALAAHQNCFESLPAFYIVLFTI